MEKWKDINIVASIRRNGSAGGYVWKLLDNN